MADSFMDDIDDSNVAFVSDDDYQQDDTMFDINFVDDTSLPQRAQGQPSQQQQQAVQQDGDYADFHGSFSFPLDPALDNTFNEMYNTVLESRQAHDRRYSNTESGYVDVEGEPELEPEGEGKGDYFNGYMYNAPGTSGDDMEMMARDLDLDLDPALAMAVNQGQGALACVAPQDLELGGFAQPPQQQPQEEQQEPKFPAALLHLLAFDDSPGAAASSQSVQWGPDPEQPMAPVAVDANAHVHVHAEQQEPQDLQLPSVGVYSPPPGQMPEHDLGFAYVKSPGNPPVQQYYLHQSKRSEQNNNNTNKTLPGAGSASPHAPNPSHCPQPPLINLPAADPNNLYSESLLGRNPHLHPSPIPTDSNTITYPHQQFIMSPPDHEGSARPGPSLHTEPSVEASTEQPPPPLATPPDTQVMAENDKHASPTASTVQQKPEQDKGKGKAPTQPLSQLDTQQVTREYPAQMEMEIPRCVKSFTTFFATRSNDRVQANCYVQRFTPVIESKEQAPILFVHGDHHTGQHWQYSPVPENLSWLDHFLHQGFTCFVPDMPMSGRSMGALISADIAHGKDLRMNQVEGNLTSPRDNLFPLYDTAKYHNQFPGHQQNPSPDDDVAGLKHDPYFLNYFASRVPVWSSQEERIDTGADAIGKVLDLISQPTVIIAEGSGCVSSLLAADRFPEKVAGLVLMGYPYAPFARPFQDVKFDNGHAKLYHADTMEAFPGLTNGLTMADLHYDPPLPQMQNLGFVQSPTGPHGSSCFLQDETKQPVRRLANLGRVPHLVVTPEAGSNSAYDWSMVAFLRQAGVSVDWCQLAEHGFLGNGQLLWLEKNALDIAALLQHWVRAKTGTAAAAAAPGLPVPQPAEVDEARRRADAVRGSAAADAARYDAAVEARRACWARKEIAPLSQVHADAQSCYYSWLPELDQARAQFQASLAARAARPRRRRAAKK